MKINLLTIILVAFSKLLYGQTCQKLERDLFNVIPKEIPDTINCIDQFGMKQGWWFYFTKEYFGGESPKDTGENVYVPEYTFGKYVNNLKVGKWSLVNNVHLVGIMSWTQYTYSNDTVNVFIQDANGSTSNINFVNDSLDIIADRTSKNNPIPINFKCNKLKGVCNISYKGELIGSCGYSDFEIELDMCYTKYERELRAIDTKAK